MFKNLPWSTGLINSDNLLIFKFRNTKFDLKDNFVNNKKSSDTCIFKMTEARRLKKSFRGSNFVQKFGPF